MQEDIQLFSISATQAQITEAYAPVNLAVFDGFAVRLVKFHGEFERWHAHENEDDYFEKLLESQLAGVSESKKKELLEKRRAYSNNKNIYSLLLQYAAGFGKSNIIGWTALQLKDLRRPYNGRYEYVYDKIFIIVDRLIMKI